MRTVIEKKLDTRFKEFLDTFAGIENIDNLNLTQQQKDESKADYFAENRQLIIELKSLETDTEHKIEKILEPHRSRPEFPDFFGKWQVSKILRSCLKTQKGFSRRSIRRIMAI